jgi:hypothetical protein
VRAPRSRNSPIDQARKDVWLQDFVGYRSAVNQGRIEAWMRQFSGKDRDAAARMLDAVDFYGPERIAHAYRAGLAALPEWHPTASKRTGRWRFVPMSSSAGDSGGTMLHQFRLANKMSRSVYDKMFVFPSMLVEEELGPEDTVVLLDDFVGTGRQVTDAWRLSFSELVAGAGTVYLMVVVARRRGREKVQTETDLVVQAAHELVDSDDLFGDDCQHFTADEKKALRKYCKRASPAEPAGFGGCGLLIVFSHRCPNDSVAALHASHSKWRGLFPRND